MNDSSAHPSNTYQVVIPQLGLTMKEATINEWLHPDGAWVEKGEPLFLLENEKSIVEVEAPASGKLIIQTQSGIEVPVLHPVALLELKENVAKHHTITGKPQAPIDESHTPAAPDVSIIKTRGDQRVSASPRARIAAKEKGIDLSQQSGSGIRGMITMRDLDMAYSEDKEAVLASPVASKIAAQEQLDLSQIQGNGPRGMIMREDVEQHIQAQSTRPDIQDISGLSGLRAIIADRLSQSWRASPHVTLTTEVDATRLVAFRNQLNQLLTEKQGSKISYNTLLAKLVAQCLTEFPYMNSRLTKAGLELQQAINIGIAVDTERGLIVPVIQNILAKTLDTLQEDLQALVKRAIEGCSLPDDLSGGTFTITNLGAYGIDAFTPIINPPECAVLGVGRIHPRPMGLNGEIVLRETMVLSLSIDHRLVDGAPAARFLQKVTKLIEEPSLINLSSGRQDE
jgi:pyruvate dehydrogenase E2 component (dihydrolipoamide acetyltransferase)